MKHFVDLQAIATGKAGTDLSLPRVCQGLRDGHLQLYIHYQFLPGEAHIATKAAVELPHTYNTEQSPRQILDMVESRLTRGAVELSGTYQVKDDHYRNQIAAAITDQSATQSLNLNKAHQAIPTTLIDIDTNEQLHMLIYPEAEYASYQLNLKQRHLLDCEELMQFERSIRAYEDDSYRQLLNEHSSLKLQYQKLESKLDQLKTEPQAHSKMVYNRALGLMASAMTERDSTTKFQPYAIADSVLEALSELQSDIPLPSQDFLRDRLREYAQTELTQASPNRYQDRRFYNENG
ncbi:hypothetical protein GCM10011297_10530 [Bacterioplanes sanyensis]|uniref:hypothetical protein n=1 Tax=Bacterioplanes sanyensis TaxID=1249553 RepID=UPI0016782186|nr:hypothetical protein [Bacterioplanes sanyensis]GGY39219.1 hypothetical protein GCM10011297_10530 [Bacterioplanes sanyensis]